MNFKMKALVAAAVMATTMSGAANAITVGTNGDMFLVAFDSLSNNSYIKALGTTANVFNGNSNFTATLAGDSNWTSFSTAASFNSANVTYSVLGYSLGATSAASSVRTTAAVAPVAGANGAFDQLFNDVQGGPLNLWMTNANIGNASVTGTASRFIASSTIDASASVIGSNWENNLPLINTAAALGSNDGFYTLTRGAGVSTKTPIVASSLLGNWNLSAQGNLTYVTAAAVPEADSWAMAMLGLGLMGFVARRRSKQA